MQGGCVRGTVHLAGADGPATVTVQNEFLAVEDRNAVLACSPDIISLVDVETANVLTSDTVESGALVDVIACPAPPLWYTPAGLALVGPQALGLSCSKAEEHCATNGDTSEGTDRRMLPDASRGGS